MYIMHQSGMNMTFVYETLLENTKSRDIQNDLIFSTRIFTFECYRNCLKNILYL